MDFPDHVLFNVNVAVVAMVFRKKYGQEFERADSTTDISSASNVSYTSNSSTRSIVTSDEMWTASEKLYNTLIQCLETEDSVLNFINWFLDGVRKTFESENSFAFLKQQILVFPDTCFLCKKPYTSPQDKWCNECESHVFESKFHTWTSGNVDLDRFIRETQREAKNSTEFLRWIPFSSFTELNQIGKGGFSEVYSGNYTQDRLNGTLKQWVTNMECMIILDYLQCHSEESIKDISLEKWDEILKEFASRMRRIYENRKVLKCRSLGQSKEHSEVQVKRKSSISSITRIKNLLKKRPSLKKNKTRTSKLNPSTTANSLIRINQIPVTVSPLQNKFIQKTVALKRLVDSQDLSLNFINKMKTQYLASKKSSKFSRMYGLTQDPQTKDYFIVLQYANDHDLHKYLNQNSVSIDWYQRISLLHGIVRGIFELHKANLIHHNLHTGNILLRHNTRKEKTGRFSTSTVRTWISDSGLWGPAGSSSSGIDTSGATSMGGNSNLNSTIMGPSKEPKISPAQSMINLQKGKLYGILPYIAPEVLQGKQYTQSSDIYSLGIIMWELSNNATLGKHNLHSQPFHDQPHDINLATEIVNGKRPNIDDVASGNIPECWLNLMKKCWASKPEDRPNIEDIKKITSAWNMERSKNSLVFSFSRSGDDDDVVGQFLDAEKRRVERLNKGKQVESYNKLEEEESGNELKETVTERLNQDDNNYDSMKSRLLDFLVEAPSPNNHKDLEIIYENIDSTKKEKVDSGYQQPIMEEHEDEVKHEVEPENPIEKDRDSNRNFQEKSYVNEQKQILLGVKQDNQDSPIKNGIEANSEIGSKEISLTKEKEP